MRLGRIARGFFFVNVALWSFGFVTLMGCCAKQIPPIRPAFHKSQNPHPYKAAVFIEAEPIPNPDAMTEIGPVMYEMVLSGFHSRGSGIVIDNSDGSQILTAGHVCEDPRPEANALINGLSLTVYDWKGFGHKAEIIKVDHSKDLCLLEVKDRNYPDKVEIAERKPEISEKLFLTAYPLGVFIPDAPTMWDGYFSGTAPEGYYVLTVPVAPGSSGGGVVNQRGELVSIIGAGIVGWEETSLGASLYMIREFLQI